MVILADMEINFNMAGQKNWSVLRNKSNGFQIKIRLQYVLCYVLVACFTISCTSPEDENPEFLLQEGFTIESVVSADLIAYPMFASFDDRGRLFVFEATEPNEMSTDEMLEKPSYQIRLLTDSDQDGHFDKSVLYADKIPFPMGGTFYKGSLYVAASPDILKFTDQNDDGIADDREVVLTGWTLNHNGAILSGPFMGPDGWMYVADARRGFDITTREEKRLQGKSARIWRFRPDGSGLEWLSAGGFDNSIEIDFMPSGDPIGTMTYFREPADGQRDALMHWAYGGVYPKPQAVIDQDHLKRTGDLMPVLTKMPRVAPSGIVRFRGNTWGEEYDGSWFSAIFNTGQILQHKITPSGGSYVSDDSEFLSSTIPDFHPTDVLQDGNGDLLVIVTGGWFIKGCPLSQVAKPDVPGNIYRIRKKDGTVPVDPWGIQQELKDKKAAELIPLLDNDQPGVRKRALWELEKRGEAAFSALENRLRSPLESIRLQALYALHRIDRNESLVSVRAGLSDESETIRTAAARLCGLSMDKKSIPDLINLVEHDPSLSVRRQAATALGQIGSDSAIPALLKASKGIKDRFLLHAIRYSLISINKPDRVLPALDHKDPSVRRTALIVLDQMDDSPLTRQHVRPFLQSNDKESQVTGVWVVQHHPEWSDIVTDYLAGILSRNSIDDSTLTTFQNILITFCADSSLQKFIAHQIKNKTLSDSIRVVLLEAMSQCPGVVPQIWKPALKNMLQSSSPEVLSAALDVIGSRQVTGLENDLNQLLNNLSNEPSRFLEVLQTRLATVPLLSDEEFKRTTSFLGSSEPIPVRRSAIRTLEMATLSDDQLYYIAQNSIPSASKIELPGLAGLFTGDSVSATGQRLVASLTTKSDALTTLSEQKLMSILDGYPDAVKKSAQPILENWHEQSKGRLSRLNNIEKNLVSGDVGRGRDLFFGKAICSTCHTVGQEGNNFGPDLTNIGEIRSRHDLMEAIVFPGASYAREYETYIVKTNEGTYTGILDPMSPAGMVTIKTAPGQVTRVPEDEVISIEPGDVSLMPAGLDGQLSNQEMSDLIAFLEALPYRIDRLIKLSE